MVVTIFENVRSKKPNYIDVDKALQRIKEGRSEAKNTKIRGTEDKDVRDEIKKSLPSVIFSGKFKARGDDSIVEYSNLIVLDFDKLDRVSDKKAELCASDFCFACWVSPSGNGLKMLIKIADGKKHQQHFDALRDFFPEIDRACRNIERLCFESFDEEIYINKNSKVFTEIKTVEKIEVRTVVDDLYKKFQSIVTWLTNKGEAFVSGERNNFIFKLASACCRFGIDKYEAQNLIKFKFDIVANKFSEAECDQTVDSAYKSSKNVFGSAHFEDTRLVDKISRGEILIAEDLVDESVEKKDVIFYQDISKNAIDIFENGYKQVNGIGVPQLDELFKFKEADITLLSGYGNYGKSSFWCWIMLMRAIKFNEKFAVFSPEENEVEFYHNLVEIYLGKDCTPANKTDKPTRKEYEDALKIVGDRFFYVYPETSSPTPDYIKKTFLKLIVTKGIKGVVIDPFNQMYNDYSKDNGRSDKYLEKFISDCKRFAVKNNVYFTIIAHPTKPLSKDSKGNYPCPDVFDIADGAMWNNKMDNILIYDRPNHQNDPNSNECAFYSKKIRRQKIVGKKGNVIFNYVRKTRRYIFLGVDYMDLLINGNVKNTMPTSKEFEINSEDIEKLYSSFENTINTQQDENTNLF